MRICLYQSNQGIKKSFISLYTNSKLFTIIESNHKPISLSFIFIADAQALDIEIENTDYTNDSDDSHSLPYKVSHPDTPVSHSFNASNYDSSYYEDSVPRNTPRIVVTPTPEEDAIRRKSFGTVDMELQRQNSTFAMLSFKLNELSKNNFDMDDKSYIGDDCKVPCGPESPRSNEDNGHQGGPLEETHSSSESSDEYETDEDSDENEDGVDEVRKSNRSLPAIRSVTNITVYDDGNEEDGDEEMADDEVFQPPEVYDYNHSHNQRPLDNYLGIPPCEDIDSLSVIYEEDEIMSTRGRLRTESRASTVSNCSTTIAHNESGSDGEGDGVAKQGDADQNELHDTENMVTVRLPLRVSMSRSSTGEDVATLVVGRSEVENNSGAKIYESMSSNAYHDSDVNISFSVRRSHSRSIDRGAPDTDWPRNSVDFDDNCSEVSVSLSLPKNTSKSDCNVETEFVDSQQYVANKPADSEESKVCVRERIAVFNKPGDDPKTPILNKRQSWPVYRGPFEDSDSETEAGPVCSFTLKPPIKTNETKTSDTSFVSNVEENILPFRERLAAFESKRHSAVYARNDPWDSGSSDDEPEKADEPPVRPKTPEEYLVARQPGWLTPTLPTSPIKYEKFEEVVKDEPIYQLDAKIESAEECEPQFYDATDQLQTLTGDDDVTFDPKEPIFSIRDRIAAFETPTTSYIEQSSDFTQEYSSNRERSISREPPPVPARGRSTSREPSISVSRNRVASRERSITRDWAPSKEPAFTNPRDRAPSRDRTYVTARERAPSRGPTVTASREREPSVEPLITAPRVRELSRERSFRENAPSRGPTLAGYREQSVEPLRDRAPSRGPTIGNANRERESSIERQITAPRIRESSRERAFSTSRDSAPSRGPIASYRDSSAERTVIAPRIRELSRERSFRDNAPSRGPSAGLREPSVERTVTAPRIREFNRESAFRENAGSRGPSATDYKDRESSTERSIRDRAPSREPSFRSSRDSGEYKDWSYRDNAPSRGPSLYEYKDRELSTEPVLRERAASREPSFRSSRDSGEFKDWSYRERAASRGPSSTDYRDRESSTEPSTRDRASSREPSFRSNRNSAEFVREGSVYTLKHRETSTDRTTTASEEPKAFIQKEILPSVPSVPVPNIPSPTIKREIKKLDRNSFMQKSSQDESEIDEDDSGVTSDINRPVSETDDTESECFPELKKLTRYQRAATHSRLFKLLQDMDDVEVDEDDYSPTSNKHKESTSTTPSDSPTPFYRPKKIVHNVSITRKQNPDALKHAETMEERRERLSLQLKPSTSIDTDNLSSPSSPTPSVNEKLVEELVQSVLRQQKLKNIKNIPMEKIHAAAKKALQEETDSGDNTCSSSFDSTPAITPQEFKDDCDDDSDTWNSGDRRTSSDILPSKAFKNLQEQSMYGRKRKLWAARCPRVLSSKTVNRDLSQVAEMPEQSSPEPHSHSPYSYRSSVSPMFNV